MRAILIFSLVLVYITGITCKKDNQPERFCWQILDYIGNDLNIVCDKTEDELMACLQNGTCASTGSVTQYTPCNYYKLGGEKYCWRINGIYFDSCTKNKIELISKCFFGNAPYTQIICDCKKWYHREKRIYKPNMTTTYSAITLEQFCGDTTATLYQGREIVRKNDPDSLISIQFSSNGINW